MEGVGIRESKPLVKELYLVGVVMVVTFILRYFY